MINTIKLEQIKNLFIYLWDILRSFCHELFFFCCIINITKLFLYLIKYLLTIIMEIITRQKLKKKYNNDKNNPPIFKCKKII